MKKLALIFLLATGLLLTGCFSGIRIDHAIGKYDEVEHQISLGDPKDKVLAILLPTQESVPRNSTKKPDKYIKDEIIVEIFYMRTGLQPDGITTDDEFTPYLFNNDKLVGIGWNVLGGATSHGQVRDQINIDNSTKTIVY